MADIFDPDKRSDIMSRIRGKNTKVELLVCGYLRKNGIYFRKHYRTKEGVVLDLALPRKKKAVFIDGDFWHGRTYDKVLSRRGKDDFWTKKLERNIERDRAQIKLLTESGWAILRVWESEIVKKKTQKEQFDKIVSFLKG